MRKKRWHGMSVVAEVSPDDVLPFTGLKVPPLSYEFGGILYEVHMDSQRYAVFKLSRVCVDCGIVGVMMRLERHWHTQPAHRYHFNLYAVVDGAVVLMTRDHKLARSLGGDNTLSNQQTMCSPCNTKKSLPEQALRAQRTQRGVLESSTAWGT